jgi:hypothetical protein
MVVRPPAGVVAVCVGTWTITEPVSPEPDGGTVTVEGVVPEYVTVTVV